MSGGLAFDELIQALQIDEPSGSDAVGFDFAFIEKVVNVAPAQGGVLGGGCGSGPPGRGDSALSGGCGDGRFFWCDHKEYL